MTIEPETGLVISYSYLWAREHEKGEEAGRKARPACVVVPLTARGGDVVLFPLTTREPDPGRVAVRIPEIERRRLKLKGHGPSWILLDEGNRDVLPGSWHVEPVSHDPLTFSYGKFSRAFVAQMLRVLADAIRSRRVAMIPRQR